MSALGFSMTANGKVTPMTASGFFASGKGKFHSDGSTKNPRPLTTTSMTKIVEMMAAPQSCAKDNCLWVIPSTLLTRNKAAQLDNGRFLALWGDLDGEKITPTTEVAAMVSARLSGARVLAYSSSSATEQRQKARILVPLAEHVDGATYQRMARAFNDLLAELGFEPDRIVESANQVLYLPNRGEFYATSDDGAHSLDPAFFAGEVAAFEAEEAAEEAAIKAARVISAEALQARMASGEKSPITAFNTCYDVETMWRHYGATGRSGRLLSPFSESGSPAIRIKDGKWYSDHGSDVDRGIGQVKDQSCWGDAFDLFKYFEHGNDERAAVIAAGKLTGVTEQNRDAWRAERLLERQRQQEATAADQEAEPDQEVEPDQEEEQQPEPAFDNELPGRLGELQLAIFNRMRKPSALGAAMVALTVCGHLLGRRVLGPTNLGCNLQTIICAATGRGKDSLVGAPEWLMKPLGDDLQATIAGQFASRPALHEHLMHQPCTLASIDEIGHMMKAIGNPTNSHMHDLGGFIMELFSSASKTIIPRGRRKAKGVVDLEPVKHPHFSLVGATTPAMLGLALTSDMTAAGQLNRLLICCLDDWNGHRQKPLFSGAPAWWAGWVDSLQSTYPDPGDFGEPVAMVWTKDADAFFWSEDARRDDLLDGQPDMVQQLRRRDIEHALKIAQIVALADFKTEVTRSNLEWAFSFVDRLQWAVLDLCRAEGILQGSSLDAVAKTAADHLRKHGPKTEARLAADCRVFGETKSGDRAHVTRIMRESFGVTSAATGRTTKLAVLR